MRYLRYQSYGVRVSSKGDYAFGPVHEGRSRREAADNRRAICSEMDGKDRVYKRAITYRNGQFFKLQDIS